MLEMKENRVYRPFLGGKMLDELSGTEPASDGHYPERWICSTTAASDGTGISVTTDGKLLTEYVKEPLPILVKLLDSYSRLMMLVQQSIFIQIKGRRKAGIYSGHGQSMAKTHMFILDLKRALQRKSGDYFMKNKM